MNQIHDVWTEGRQDHTRVLCVPQPNASFIAAGVQTILTRSFQDDYRGCVWIHANGTAPENLALPLGAIVAVATLVDVVPIVGCDQVINRRPPARFNRRPPARFVVDTSNMGGCLCLCSADNRRQDDITDQRPYGDFTPGRFAWLLADVKSVCCPVETAG